MRCIIPCPEGCDFPLENIPFGIFSEKNGSGAPRVCTALGSSIVDLSAVHQAGLFTGPQLSRRSSCFDQGTLNEFMSLGRPAWKETRETLIRLFSSGEGVVRDDAETWSKLVYHQDDVNMHLPAAIGDYTDFYASQEYATNGGTILRGKDNALNRNWLHLPVGYHGRSSSIVVSGTDVVRPRGQTSATGKDPEFGCSTVIDFELEMGALIGPGNNLGSPISIDDAWDHVFGLVLMNDWSARDIQKWEYVPLGPFNSKNWATTISPWVITLEALEPFKCDAPVQEPTVLPYLQELTRVTYDINLQVDLTLANSTKPEVVTRSNLKNLYWTFPQMVAHHTVGGCNLRPGDLLGTGTISCKGDKGKACLMEILQGPKPERSVEPDSGKTLTYYLQDGDIVKLKGSCESNNRIGFGECTGKLIQNKT